MDDDTVARKLSFRNASDDVAEEEAIKLQAELKEQAATAESLPEAVEAAKGAEAEGAAGALDIPEPAGSPGSGLLSARWVEAPPNLEDPLIITYSTACNAHSPDAVRLALAQAALKPTLDPPPQCLPPPGAYGDDDLAYLEALRSKVAAAATMSGSAATSASVSVSPVAVSAAPAPSSAPPASSVLGDVPECPGVSKPHRDTRLRPQNKPVLQLQIPKPPEAPPNCGRLMIPQRSGRNSGSQCFRTRAQMEADEAAASSDAQPLLGSSAGGNGRDGGSGGSDGGGVRKYESEEEEGLGWLLFGGELTAALLRSVSRWPPNCDEVGSLLGQRAIGAVTSIGVFVDGTVAYTLSKTWHDLLFTFVFGLHPVREQAARTQCVVSRASSLYVCETDPNPVCGKYSIQLVCV